MEVALGVQVGDLGPLVTCHVVDFALVHRLVGQRRSDCEDLAALALNNHTGQRVCPPLKQHVAFLHQPLLHELVAELGGLARLATPRQEDAALLVFDGHEVGGDLDVDYVGAVAVRTEIVHEQIVRIVDEEVKSVEHVAVVLEHGDLERGFDDLPDFSFCSSPVLDEFDGLLLLLLLDQVRGIFRQFLRELHNLVDLLSFLQKMRIVSIFKIYFF